MSIKAKLWSIIIFIFIGALVAQISLYITGKDIEEEIVKLQKTYHKNEELHKFFEEVLTLKNAYSTIIIDPSNNFARDKMYFPALNYIKSHENMLIKDENVRKLLDNFVNFTLNTVKNINPQNQQQYMQQSIQTQLSVWQPFRMSFNKIIADSEQQTKSQESETIDYVKSAGIKLMVSLVMAFLVAVATFFVEKDIQSSISKLLNIIENITNTMKFDYFKRNDPQLSGEFGYIVKALKKMINELDDSVEEVEKVMSSVSKGDFKARINDAQLEGDIKKMAGIINTSLAKFETTLENITKAFEEISKGNLSIRLDDSNLEGELRTLVNYMNKSLEKLNIIVNDMKITLENLAMGDLSVRIKEFAGGDIGITQQLINSYIDNISTSLGTLRKLMESALMS